MTAATPSPLHDILDDLAAIGARLDELVATLDPAHWRLPTPAAGWDVATSIAHLAWTDEAALLAIGATGPDGKAAWDALVLQAIADPEGLVDRAAVETAALPQAELLDRWRTHRHELARALAELPRETKLPWFGPPMSATSMATARLMETWAHGQDVYAALGVRPEHGDELRHVAHLGVRTRDFSFRTRGLTPPAQEFLVQLVAPSGQEWTWGSLEATQQVSGVALDFCQLVTQRVHRDDTSLVTTGVEAEQWLQIAQCFAGPSGGGREARS